MKVLNVVSILSAREGGGNAERTSQLSRAVISAGDSCSIITLDIGDWKAREEQLKNTTLIVLPCLSERHQLPFPSWSKIVEQVHRADIIHFMGYWSPLSILVSLAAKRYGVPFLISPAGALPFFGRSKFRKQIFNFMIGRRYVSQASGWIAITKSELPDFKEYGVPIEQVAVIPNGIFEDDFFCNEEYQSQFTKSLPRDCFILFMGRLNPIKGPDLLLEAFNLINHKFKGVNLLFVGQDEGMRASLEMRAKVLGIVNKVFFLDFLDGLKKVATYRAAVLLVVPSRSEAMSLVAIEAGICGVPVLITDQCGLHDLSEVNPVLVVSASVEGLAVGLGLALSNPVRLKAWGEKWQLLVRDRFLWSNLVFKFQNYCREIISRHDGK